MALPVDQLAVGHRYKTSQGEVRQIVAFDGGHVIYVVEYNGRFPVWNRATWLKTLRGVFAKEAEREFPFGKSGGCFQR
jgi:hypothetical protein